MDAWPGDSLSYFRRDRKPRPQQIEALRRIDDAFGRGVPIVALEAPTGAGKSLVQMAAAENVRQHDGATHWLCPQKGLQDQLESEFRAPEIELLKGRNAYPCNHQRARPGDDCSEAPCTRRGESILPACIQDPYTPMAVATMTAPPHAVMCPYWRQLLTANASRVTLFNFASFLFQQRLGRFGDRDLLVLDECFVGSTSIACPDGEKRIDELKVGDEVRHAFGVGIVQGISTKQTTKLVKVEFDDGSEFTSTETHPVFTQSGWKFAARLGEGDHAFTEKGLRLLQEGVQAKEMAVQEVSRAVRGRVKGLVESADALLKILRKEASQSDAQPRKRQKDGCDIAPYTASTLEARRERNGFDEATKDVAGCSRRLLETRSGGMHGQNEGVGISALLQDRPCERGPDDRNRGRRQQPLRGAEKAGSKEGQASYFPRVVRVSHIQRSGYELVYNLRVSGHPSYFAEGKLVHNCHNAESELMNFVKLELLERDLDLADIALPKVSDAASLMAWMDKGDIEERIKIKIDSLKDRLGTADLVGGEDKDARRLKDRLEQLLIKIALFRTLMLKARWVVSTEDQGPKFGRALICRPIHARSFARDLLFSKGKRVLAVSATILSKEIWQRGLGLRDEEVEFIRLGSDFPVENRPIVLEYVGPMDYKNKAVTIPKLVAWLRDVCLPRHRNERGIIHAHSFEIANAIVAGVKNPRLRLHVQGENKLAVLADHSKRSDSVIVAPGFFEGVDLRDDLSRWQVLPKIPFPNMKDAVVEARMKEDPRWYTWQTSIRISQASGRSVRSSTDHAITYITDQGFDGFRSRAGGMLPPWFVEAIRRAPVAPAPLKTV